MNDTHLAFVLAQYDLGQVHAVEPQPGGGIDESFRVTCQRGPLFFKRRSPQYTASADGSRPTVAADHDLIQFLVRCAFPTPPVVPARDGRTWVEWEGRIYEAYPYVEGKGFALGNSSQMASLGRTVARYHRLVAGYRPPFLKLPPWGNTSVTAFLDLGEYASPRLEVLLAQDRVGEPEVRFVRQVTEQLQGQAEAAREERDLVSLTVHGALEPGNVLFGQEDQVVAWVDWADSAQFVRAYDVAHALLKFGGRRPDAILPGQVGPALSQPGVEAFAAAYRQEVALNEAEAALLPWLMLACRIVDALWVDGAERMDYRRELCLAERLYDWLMQNRTFLRKAFC